jgi:hypothetical protein
MRSARTGDEFKPPRREGAASHHCQRVRIGAGRVGCVNSVSPNLQGDGAGASFAVSADARRVLGRDESARADFAAWFLKAVWLSGRAGLPSSRGCCSRSSGSHAKLALGQQGDRRRIVRPQSISPRRSCGRCGRVEACRLAVCASSRAVRIFFSVLMSESRSALGFVPLSAHLSESEGGSERATT